MEINRKKKEVELGVMPIASPAVAKPAVDTEEIKRKNYTEWSEKNYPKPKNTSKSPSHYGWFEEKFGIPLHVILGCFTFNIGCAMKYLIRHGRKKSMSMNEREKAIDDLKKAIDFINFEIERLS